MLSFNKQVTGAESKVAAIEEPLIDRDSPYEGGGSAGKPGAGNDGAKADGQGAKDGGQQNGSNAGAQDGAIVQNMVPQEVNAAKIGMGKEAYLNLLKSMQDEEVPNYTDLRVDFNEQLNSYKKRTEQDLPFTMTQINDVCYLDQYNIISFEYHCYQPNAKYHKLRRLEETINKNGTLIDSKGEKVQNLLRTQEHQRTTRAHPMSAFSRDGIRNYADAGEDLVQAEREATVASFMTIDNKLLDDQFTSDVTQERKQLMEEKAKNKSMRIPGDQMVQGILCLYTVNPEGGLMKRMETDVRMGRKFMKPKGGNMCLTRSKDRRLISITNFEKDNSKGEYFRVYAWSTRQLRQIDVSERLHAKMNQFYHENKGTFQELLEVSFCGAGQYVQLIYMEQVERSIQEQQEYELAIYEAIQQKEKRMLNTQATLGTQGQKPTESKPKSTSKGQDEGTQRVLSVSPRRARKYVFFNAKTGEIVFEWGGIMVPQYCTGKDNELVRMYELSMLIKESKNEDGPLLYFALAGDFLDESVKDYQTYFNWAMILVEIPLDQLFSIDHENQLTMIRNEAQKFVNVELGPDTKILPYYPFNGNWIIKQIFNWQSNIQLVANRRIDQFMILNMSSDPLEDLNKSIYIHGPKYKSYLKVKQVQRRVVEVPFLKQYPYETDLQLGRNSQVKDQLFYHIVKKDETRTYCCRMDHQLVSMRHKCIQIPILNYDSMPDCWIHEKKSARVDCGDTFQTLSVDNYYGWFAVQTRPPYDARRMEEGSELLLRRSDSINQQVACYPFITHNLGDQRLVLVKKTPARRVKFHIIELDPEERFISFIEFNKYQDIGFYAQDLRIECCSCFLFLTTKRHKSDDDMNTTFFNLLLADPYHDEIQVAIFRSNSNVDDDLFQQGDLIVKSCLTSTMAMRKESKYKMYLWTQFPEKIIKQVVSLGQRSQGEEGKGDSDKEKDKRGDGAPDSEDDSEYDKIFYQYVPMIKDDYDYLFYVVKKNKELLIMEGNPRDPFLQNHYPVFKIKVKKCLAFTIRQNTFYFMDENKFIYMLRRTGQNRNLDLIKELAMEVMQRLDYKPSEFEEQIICEKYAVHKSKIFYLYDTSDPNQRSLNTLFDFEELIEEKPGEVRRKILKSPLVCAGSQTFIDFFQFCRTKAFLRWYSLPDVVQTTLVNDRLNKVIMSTFMEDGDIILMIGSRFLHFCSDRGDFIGQLKFNDEALGHRPGKSKGHAMPPRQVRQKTEEDQDPEGNAREREPILDFLGNPYDAGERDPEPEIDDSNRMELIQISQNNRLYLFLDRIERRFMLYELKPREPDLDQSQLDGMIKEKISNYLQDAFKEGEGNQQSAQGQAVTHRWKLQFMVRYTSGLDDSEMFQQMDAQNVDFAEFFRQNKYQIKMDNSGTVKFCFIEHFPGARIKDFRNEEAPDPNIKCRFNCSIMTEKQGSMSATHTFYTSTVNFPTDALIRLSQIVDKQKIYIERDLKKIRVEQSRLPKKYFDYSKYEFLVEDLRELEGRRADHIDAKYFFDNLVIIYCGCYLKFGFLPRDQKKSSDSDQKSDIALQDINLKFAEGVEIVKIIETVRKNWLQIYTIDHDLQVISILIWDFDLNTEQGVMQLHFTPGQSDIGYHLVKGMNHKMNYLVDENYVVDLEHNIPTRQSNVNQGIDLREESYRKQLQMSKDFYNQRKVHFDGQRFLGIEKPSCLYFPLTRMNILLWRNISQMRDPESYLTLCSIRHLNLVFDGVSFFHYYAEKSRYIDLFCQTYLKCKDDEALQGTDWTFPLQILNPDNEAKTAINLAVASQSYKSLESMMEVLVDFPDIPLSKMFLRQLEPILNSGLGSVQKFFNDKRFQPPQMNIEFAIPWDDSTEEATFASHTSICSRDLLIQGLIETGAIDKEILEEGDDDHHCDDERLDKFEKRLATKLKPRDLKLSPAAEHTHSENEGEDAFRRVKIQALDMDWLFHEDNFTTMLAYLADSDNDSILTALQIRVCIDFVWTFYQRAIIKFIFIPYILYLQLISQISGSLAAEYIESLHGDMEDQANQDKFQWIKIKCYAVTTVTTLLMISFATLESQQILDGGLLNYVSDHWNCIDGCSILCNFTMLTSFTMTMCMQNEWISIEFIRTIGACSSFLMWIKVFYWMRLFSSLAYYVKLIQDTIAESGAFMLMVAIIICSFANLFFVINLNLGPDADYYKPYFGESSEAIDSIVSVYMLGALGDFESDDFSQGYNATLAMSFFILGTFVIQVVFMNMLIAIMGDTFARVQEVAEESGLKERVVLINDHDWLIDIKQLFKGKKYIFIVSPETYQEEQDKDAVVGKVLKETERNLREKLDIAWAGLKKRVAGVDDSGQFVLGNQYAMVEAIQSRIKKLEKQLKKSAEERDSGGGHTDEATKRRHKELQKKQGNIIHSLSEQMKGNKSQQLDCLEIAQTWLGLADSNNDGQIQKKELYDFFAQIDGINLSPEEIAQLFSSMDDNNNGYLTAEEFARAIYQVIFAERDAASSLEGISEQYGEEEDGSAK